jgi:hypothetical protein
VVFPSTYANLLPYETVIEAGEIAGMYYKPWTSKYGTWIEADGNTGVYSAYQDGHKVIFYPAKKNSYKNPVTGETKQYYKIAAFDKDRAYAAMETYMQEQFLDQDAIWEMPDGTYEYPLGNTLPITRINQLVYEPGTQNVPINAWGYWTQVDDGFGNLVPQFNAITAFDGLDEDELPEVLEYPDEILDEDVPFQIEELVKARLSFGSQAATLKGVDLPTELLAKAWMAAGTAVIISKNSQIPYLQKTNPDQKYQSTVDLANQLVVAYTDILPDNNTNFYYLAEVDGEDGWVHHNNKAFKEVIKEGKVCFMKTAENGQGGRDFMDIEIVSEDEATAIGGVMEYISAKNNDGVIYNVQGMKVASPVKGQMYIQNGNKFIQK